MKLLRIINASTHEIVERQNENTCHFCGEFNKRGFKSRRVQVMADTEFKYQTYICDDCVTNLFDLLQFSGNESKK